MTIDEAIAQEIMFSKEDWHKRKEYHEQIAEWLEELKKLRQCTNIENREYPYFDGFKEGKQVGYNKAIDDFVNNIKEELDRFEVQNLDTCVLYDLIDRKAEQLKAGGNSDD